MPRVRMEAVKLVRSGWTMSKVARHLGFTQGAISKWVAKAPQHGNSVIPTLSSRPYRHPKELNPDIVNAIVYIRKKHNRCGEVIYEELKNQGIKTSLSSVQRTLARKNLIKERSPWKRWHRTIDRPIVEKPGDLVQIDTIHIQPKKGCKFYIYTLIDLHSRFAHAKVVSKINTHGSLKFAHEAEKIAGFQFITIQSDYGSEFSSWFTENIGAKGIAHRHSRIRQPNDNAHIERFNRTIQEECLDRVEKEFYAYCKATNLYLKYYNNERMHMGINFLTPFKKLTETIPSY